MYLGGEYVAALVHDGSAIGACDDESWSFSSVYGDYLLSMCYGNLALVFDDDWW